MDLKIKNKVCIITGGAKGIGYGIAKIMGYGGWNSCSFFKIYA